MATFIQSGTGVRRKVLGPFHRLWSLLFGWLYYAAKGMWGVAFLSLITINGLLIGFPLWNRMLVERHYEDRGWIKLGGVK